MKKSLKTLSVLLTALTVLAACDNGSQSQTDAAQQAVSVPMGASAVPEADEPNLTASEASGEVVDAAHTAENALNWSGTYKGKFPCASCEYIDTTLVLNDDGSYELTSDYQGGKEPLVEKEKGEFEWNDEGSIIELEPEGHDHSHDDGDHDDDEHVRFFVAEGHVQQLAKGSSQYVEGSQYRLDKQTEAK